jgi:hypothetical protein
MSDDKISRVIRERPSDRRTGDDPLRQARWDKRLEAARARRAQVLAEKRARGEAPGQTLISRRPWEDEGATPSVVPPAVATIAAPLPAAEAAAPASAQSPAQAPEPSSPRSGRVLRLVPTSPEAPPVGSPRHKTADRPDRPASGAEPAVAPAPGAFPPLELSPSLATEPDVPKRRVGPLALFGGLAIGGLVALGALFLGGNGGIAPDPAQPLGGSDAVAAAPAPTTSSAEATVAAEATVPAEAPGEAQGNVAAVPTPSVDPAQPATDAPPATTPAATEDPTPAPADALDPPRAIDLAALDAIALGAPPATEASEAGALTGQFDARAPRSFAPPPLLPPADPVLAGLGVRVQVSAPSPRPSPDTPEGSAVAGLAASPAALRNVAPAGGAALSLPAAEAVPVRLPAPLGGIVAVTAPAIFAGQPGGEETPGVAPVRPVLPLPRPAALSRVAAPVAEDAPAPSVDAPAPLPVALTPAEGMEALAGSAVPSEAPTEAPTEAPSEALSEALPEAPAEAPQAVPPPRAAEVLVHILVPRDAAPGRAAAVLGEIGATGYLSREPAEVGIAIRQTQVRYYHPEDAAAAALIAEAVGGPARDFTGFRPQPPEGTVEVWLEGEPAPAPAPEPARAPVAVRATPAPAPPPPPQPAGYCWRGEPGTPGALRVPIVDGRCAWP